MRAKLPICGDDDLMTVAKMHHVVNYDAGVRGLSALKLGL